MFVSWWNARLGAGEKCQVYELGTLGEITEEDFDKTFNTNVRGLLFTVSGARPNPSSGCCWTN